MNTFFCRAFQCCFAVGARFLPWRTPEVFSGEGSLLRAADILRENGLRRPFVIASRRGVPRAAGQAAFAACGTLKGPPPHSAAHRRAHDGGHGVGDDHRRRCHRQ